MVPVEKQTKIPFVLRDLELARIILESHCSTIQLALDQYHKNESDGWDHCRSKDQQRRWIDGKHTFRGGGTVGNAGPACADKIAAKPLERGTANYCGQ